MVSSLSLWIFVSTQSKNDNYNVEVVTFVSCFAFIGIVAVLRCCIGYLAFSSMLLVRPALRATLGKKMQKCT